MYFKLLYLSRPIMYILIKVIVKDNINQNRYRKSQDISDKSW